MKPRSPFTDVWAIRPDVAILAALAMLTFDPLRVAPQMFNDIYGGMTNSGHHLIVGVADIAALAIFAFIRPELWSVVCMVGGLTLGLIAKSVGLPALPGWFLMFTPWVIRNWSSVNLSVSEKRMLIAYPVAFCLWASLIISGHIVDPTMQGSSSIGWVYTTSDRPVEVGNPVQVRIAPCIYLTRRVASIEGDKAVIAADNLNFGEQKEVVAKSSLRKISWTWSPRRAWRSRTLEGELFNSLELSYSPKDRMVSGNRVILIRGNKFTLCSIPKGEVIASFTGAVGEASDGEAIFQPSDKGGRKYSLDLETGNIKPVKYVLKLTPFCNGPSSLSFEGDVADQLRNGMKLVVVDTQVVITSVEVRKGGPAGASTVVCFKPNLAFQPTPGVHWEILGGPAGQ